MISKVHFAKGDFQVLRQESSPVVPTFSVWKSENKNGTTVVSIGKISNARYAFSLRGMSLLQGDDAMTLAVAELELPEVCVVPVSAQELSEQIVDVEAAVAGPVVAVAERTAVGIADVG